MKPSLTILKIGGQLIEQSHLLAQVLEAFHQISGYKILVHGGGRKANQLLKSLDIQPQMQAGRRITDAPTLEVVTMVYAGWINKSIVSQLQAKGCNALGLSGADGNLIQAHQRTKGTVDYGFVGDIDQVNTSLLQALLAQGIHPVCCAITHDSNGQLLNTNADTIASSLAQSLAKDYQVSLKFCFEKQGVCHQMEDENSLIEQLHFEAYQELIKQGVITNGMIPKLDMAFEALKHDVEEVWICGTDALQRSDAQKTRLFIHH